MPSRALSGRRSPRRDVPAPEPEPEAAPGVGKGRPTPRRRDAEAARRTRATVPANRKQAQAVRRQRLREERAKQAEGMRTGDERYLTSRDAGPVKRYVRDRVDSRRHVAEYFLPLVLVVTIVAIPVSASLAGTALASAPNLLLLAVFVLVVGDGLVTARSLRRGIAERFGADRVKGNVLYGVLRSTQFRRIRQPRPQVRPGDTV